MELSGKNIDQGAFTGAVFAQERVDLAWMQDEIHAFQRQRIAEAFTDATSEDDRMNAHLTHRAKVRQAIDLVIFGLAAFRSNNVIADILLRINCRAGIDILDLFAFQDIEQQADRFIALFFRSLIDGG